MRGRAWTEEEDRILLDGAGVFSIAWFQKRVGKSYDYPNAPQRSRDAIYARSRKALGPGGFTRGTYTLLKAAEETGYTRKQILRAQSALSQKWKRLSAKGPYLITFEQLEEIVGWLRTDYWCAKLRLYGCMNCGGDSSPPRGMGLCQKCYFRIRRTVARLGLPLTARGLCQVVYKIESVPLEHHTQMVRLREQLIKGRGPTIAQMDILESLLGSPLKS